MPRPPSLISSPLLELQARLEGVRVFLSREVPEWRRLQALLAEVDPHLETTAEVVL
jgi:hypothetical protein